MGRKLMGPSTHYARMLEMLASHNSDACLEWPYGCDNDGYGVVAYLGKASRTHKVAFHLTHKRWAIPSTLHHCDNKKCFNPRHLYEGTPADNARDRMLRGQQVRGERQPTSVLTTEQVLCIRAEYKRRENGCPQLAAKYGVCPATIHSIVSRRNWRHI